MTIETRETRETWSEYRRLILAELIRLNDDIAKLEAKTEDHAEKLRTEVARQATDVQTLKVKSSLFGAAAGIVSSLIIIIIDLAFKFWK